MTTIEADQFLSKDLRVALRLGWLSADDDGASCNFCGEKAGHDAKARGYLCEHDSTCLMVRYSKLIGDVNDGDE